MSGFSKTSLIRIISALLALMGASTTQLAHAHEMKMLKVVSFENEGRGYVKINIADTQKGVSVVCAAYDQQGGLLASNTWKTENLATQVLVRYKGNDVSSVKCALN